MSPTALRRFFTCSVACALGVSCTSEHIGGYLWQYDAAQPVCKDATWHQVAPNQIPGFCSSRGRAASYGTSCALGCVVISQYSEAQAKHIDLWGDTLYDHERRHVLDRKVHPHE
jgi:hypothetical protein